eukprot:scaffold68916_cov68-Phaeocystis_antarctica.AAC.1
MCITSISLSSSSSYTTTRRSYSAHTHHARVHRRKPASVCVGMTPWCSAANPPMSAASLAGVGGTAAACGTPSSR